MEESIEMGQNALQLLLNLSNPINAGAASFSAPVFIFLNNTAPNIPFPLYKIPRRRIK